MKRERITTRVAAAFAALVTCLQPASAQEKITFLLNWVPQGDHSPYYYAKKLGWYAKEGLDLTIEGGRGSAATIQRVGAGQVPLGIADMTNVLPARGQQVDIVGVMAIYANTAFGLYWKKSSGIATPKDLVGKKIGVPAGDAVKQMWPAIAQAIGIPAQSVTWVNIAPEAKVASLQSGAIDFTQHFYSVHDVYEKTFGDDLGYLGLRHLGVNPYGLSIIANGAYLKSNPETVRKFIRVTQRAFAACIQQPEPCTRALAEETSQKPEDVLANWRRVEALVSNDTGRTVALGAFDPQRIDNDAKLVEAAFGVKVGDPTAAFSNEYLDPATKLP
jgi:NitT/TauT family transport system substrate-binding protein